MVSQLTVSKQAEHNFYSSTDLLHLSTKKSCKCSWDTVTEQEACSSACKVTKTDTRQYITASSQEVTVMKQMYKKSMSFTSTHHGGSFHKPRRIQEYKSFTGRVDMKDQELQPYKHDRSTKWYTKPTQRGH
jgi:hypothetical protein